MEELESRVRSINTSSIRGFDDDAANSAFSGEPEALHDIDDIMFDIPEGEVESYDEDDIPGLLDDGKWNGESPFVIDNQSSSSQPTLTEAEMLTRYQTMFDDEEINYDLILELLRYIVKSSYGDGAVLVFFRKCLAILYVFNQPMKISFTFLSYCCSRLGRNIRVQFNPREHASIQRLISVHCAPSSFRDPVKRSTPSVP